uniref:Uncharacterized protein ycf35 n=1 Tax=Schizymenia dubyi TaxID=38368 RepID=A0A1C9C9F9_9FLOR|nr:hypothetical protein Schiz_129 [Schizymenia dubyi]AOM65012.1 hypothetical protein Schiz_129 [Schizymenia dubyi]
MSHFSRIKTTIRNKNILKSTLNNLGFNCIAYKQLIKDANGNKQYVDIVARKDNLDLLGFIWNGKEYSIVTDLYFWNNNKSIESFIEVMLQQYALNSVTAASIEEGFQTVRQETTNDGSIKVTLQRWY